MSRNFILVILKELSKIQSTIVLQCLYHSYQCPFNFYYVEEFMSSLLLGKSTFAFKQLVNLLQVDVFAFPYLVFYWRFWWTSSWLTIIQKFDSDNQQKRSCWLGKFFEMLAKHHKETRVECQHHSLTMLITICNANDVLTAIFVQCRPGSHMLSLMC